MKDVEGDSPMVLHHGKSIQKRRRRLKNQVEKAPKSSGVCTRSRARNEKVFENRGGSSNYEDCMIICQTRDSITEKCLPENLDGKGETFAKNQILETGATGDFDKKFIQTYRRKRRKTEVLTEVEEENGGNQVVEKGYEILDVQDNCTSDKPDKGEASKRCGRNDGNVNQRQNKETTQLKEGGMTGQRIRRGRPAKLRDKQPKASVIKGSQRKIPVKVRIGEDPFKNVKKRHNYIELRKKVEYYLYRRPQLFQNHSSETGGKHIINVNNGTPTEGFVDGEKVANVCEPDCINKEFEIENTRRLSDMGGDDQPLLLCNEGLCSAMIVHGSSYVDGEKLANVCEPDCINKEVEMENARRLSDMGGDDQHHLLCNDGLCSATIEHDSRVFPNSNVQQLNEARDNQLDAQRLPFVKSSPIWETLECMEVYQNFSQNPHFSPLIEMAEESREGLAIGCMVTFASLVEKTTRLNFEDPVISFNNILEVLHDLEMHGFDVKPVQERLNELLSIKEREEKLKDQSKKENSEITDHGNVKTEIEIEIDDIDKQARELQEKRALLISRKDDEESNICMLQSKANVTLERIKRTRLDFERLVAAPLKPFLF